MIGEIINTIQPYDGGSLVVFSALGYTDYKTRIKPWAEQNLTGSIKFVASACVHIEHDADVSLFVMRWTNAAEL